VTAKSRFAAKSFILTMFWNTAIVGGATKSNKPGEVYVFGP
jgi:hypothetical protein